MITVDKGKLKFLRAGRPVQVDVPRPYRRGRLYAIRRPEKRAAVGRVIILDAFEVEPGTWRLTVRLSVEDTPVYLAGRLGGAGGDYTVNPARAAKDSDGPIERADIELEQYARRAQVAHEARRDEERSARPRTARIAALERAAQEGDQQAKRHLFVIDQRIRAHERGVPRSQNG